VTRRIYNRIYVGLEAEFFSISSAHTAFIENISEYGMYAKVASDRNIDNNTPPSCINLRLQLPAGNSLKLNCKKVWSSKNTANSLIERIGIQIIDPPDEYRDFYHLLSPR
jgi:hypothetical protein